jgi:hypothetical protein
MNKFAMIFLATAMTLGCGAALAADTGSTTGSSNNNGMANQSDSTTSKDNMAPKGVDNSQINSGSTNTNTTSGTSSSTEPSNAAKDHKKTMCKEGRCPDQTPGTKDSKATGQ